MYYDRNQPTDTLLQEFGVAGREKILFGSFMAGCGLLLLGLHFLAKRAMAGPDESEEIDIDTPEVGPEVIHVVPRDDVSTGG